MLPTKQTVAVFAFLNLFCTVFAAYPYALRCRRCDRAAYVTECHDWAQCLDDEVCYMDEVVTSSLQVYYNAGCRSKNYCEKSVGQTRRENVFVSCSRCCNDEPFCNELLCNVPKDTNAVMCYQCGYSGTPGSNIPTRYPADCNYIGPCNPGEACYQKATTDHEHEGQLLHYSKCMSLSICHYLMSSVFDAAVNPLGKRNPSNLDHNVCSVCCGDDRCNGYSCNTIKHFDNMFSKSSAADQSYIGNVQTMPNGRDNTTPSRHAQVMSISKLIISTLNLLMYFLVFQSA